MIISNIDYLDNFSLDSNIAGASKKGYPYPPKYKKFTFALAAADADAKAVGPYVGIAITKSNATALDLGYKVVAKSDSESFAFAA
ncbi:MAG: hypothetical protein VKL20_00170 [Synechocystis sp.]|nr:hypothetical protein [Synechocystis sp.]